MTFYFLYSLFLLCSAYVNCNFSGVFVMLGAKAFELCFVLFIVEILIKKIGLKTNFLL